MEKWNVCERSSSVLINNNDNDIRRMKTLIASASSGYITGGRQQRTP